MKKFTLIMMCLLMAIGYEAKAQEDYTPFVVEGKIWDFVVLPDALAPPGYEWYGKSYFKGDTIINGIACKKMYSYNVWHNDGSTMYEGALYEKDKKVYCFRPSKSKEELMYDFGLKKDDKIKTVTYMIYQEKSGGYNSPFMEDRQVLNIENHLFRGHNQRMTILCGTDVKVEEVDDYYKIWGMYGYWIEGVGTTSHPLMNWAPYCRILQVQTEAIVLDCVVNGDTIFTFKDKKEYEEKAFSKKYVSGISTVKAGGDKKSAGWYDLQGRRLTEPRKGVNIIRYNDGTARKVLK